MNADDRLLRTGHLLLADYRLSTGRPTLAVEYWLDVCSPSPAADRLVQVGYWPPSTGHRITGRLPPAAYSRPPTRNRLLLATHCWPPTGH